MKRHQFLLAVLAIACSFSFATYAQDKKILPELYIAATIPDSLKEDAHAVTRYEYAEYVVKGPEKVTYKYHSIVTILNEKGDHNAGFGMDYNKFKSINGFQMIIYSAAGLKIKKYGKSDMYDQSATDGSTMVTDDRILSIRHTIASYPCTIEIIMETTQNSYLNLGGWTPQVNEESTQNSICSVTVSPTAGFRYVSRNTSVKPTKTTQDGLETYTWIANNIKAVKVEDNAVAWQVFPKVTFVNNAFVFANIPGDFSTWQNYGKWQLGVNADVCSLSPQRASEIQAMTAGIKTDKEKARFLYQYMQKNMRYVSIQLGIGGLKPFPAGFVDDKKYGDCKALSNYMYALLKAVNIPAYYAMVRAGSNEEPADANFPTDPFNHVILCVPFKGDTTWLECTSSTHTFGKLGPFTENRNALLITEDGGKLVNTPRSNAADNQFNSSVHIVLDADGGAKATAKLMSTGEFRELYLEIASEKTDEQKEYLIKSLNIKQPSDFVFKPLSDNDGTDEVELMMEYDKFCDIATGNKQFYRPRIFDLWQATYPAVDKRKSDFFFKYPSQRSCVTTIDLPAGFDVETLPTNQMLKFTYGNFEVNYAYDAAKNQVTSTAKFNLNSHIIPAAKYAEMQQYMDNVARAQNKKLVIRKKA
ncbi:DUF3857 domain-containing protein [Mucilaginibacter psychrotolerans]|uniref:DUF3857 domain-containing protein n=1 Tax=Mucilaginibacter psychrotolerans TaxID=1524096 RepID=A0A4Y8SHD2_9SPHI|nr:DUF3857 domain-containing protein [Mucilaginibacter psychrotolerans]TFF38459.1 DUF3857 domain-containing protein [Mucilaginibacter psychrotolerans]